MLKKFIKLCLVCRRIVASYDEKKYKPGTRTKKEQRANLYADKNLTISDGICSYDRKCKEKYIMGNFRRMR